MIETILRRRQALGLAALAGSFWFIGGPALAQSRPFSIFFDYERTEVTPAAKEIVAAVKDLIKSNTRIMIVGHCDTAEAGPAKLSLARALEVEKALIELGLPAGTQLTIVGRGATELRKQTGPNVREPINRYVAITIN